MTEEGAEVFRISVERDRCEGFGFCEEAAPTIFALDEEGELIVHHSEVRPENRATVAAAVRACPVAALRWDENSGGGVADD